MVDYACDVAVIGAGTAGLAAYRAARAAGAHALIIEAGPGGTTCARVGCMPAKLILAAAEAAQAVRTAAVFGIRTPQPIVDGRAVMQRVKAERDRFVAHALADYEDLPAETRIAGRARFEMPDLLHLEDGRSISARAVVIATGSHPVVPPPYRALGSDRVLTTDTLFDLDDLPSSLAIIGGGALGLEQGQAMARLGVRTALFDGSEEIGGLTDADALCAAKRLIGRDLTLRLGIKPEPSLTDDGIRLQWTEAGAQRSETFDRVLVATGRAPALDGLDLEQAGLALDDHGVPRFDPATMRCGQSSIFIAGDADAERPILHEASRQGEIAGDNAARRSDPVPQGRPAPFTIVYTAPNLATIGLLGGALDEEKHVVGSASYDDQGRARIADQLGGTIRLYAERTTGRLLGAEMVGPRVEHTAHLVMFAVERRLTASEMLALPVYHPSFEEALHTALRSVCAALHDAGHAGRLHPQDGA